MKLFKQAARYGSGALATVGGSMLLVTQAYAGPIETILAGVDLATVATTIAALALILVAIKLTFKGPDVAGRVIKKV